MKILKDNESGKLDTPIKCSLCNVEMNNIHETNNPYPLCDYDDTESRCCHNCNYSKVIPARMRGFFVGSSKGVK
jgi:hypothetical protein